MSALTTVEKHNIKTNSLQFWFFFMSLSNDYIFNLI